MRRREHDAKTGARRQSVGRGVSTIATPAGETAVNTAIDDAMPPKRKKTLLASDAAAMDDEERGMACDDGSGSGEGNDSGRQAAVGDGAMGDAAIRDAAPQKKKKSRSAAASKSKGDKRREAERKTGSDQ